MEARALEQLSGSDLPAPRVNAWLADPALEVDLLWEGASLVVELDGRRYHAHRAARDADRDALLASHGYRVRRFGWGDVSAGSFIAEVASEIRRTAS